MLSDGLIENLRVLRESPAFSHLKDFLHIRIEQLRQDLEVRDHRFNIYRIQGAIAEIRSVLKTFEDLELFVKQQDNPIRSDPELS